MHKRSLGRSVRLWLRSGLLLCWAILWASALPPARAALDDPAVPCPPRIDPRVPLPPGCQEDPVVDPRNFCLSLRAAALDDEILHYTLTVRSVGSQGGDQLVARLPYTPPSQELASAEFSSPEAWVSEVTTSTIRMDLGGIERGEAVSATLRLRLRRLGPNDTLPPLRATLDWKYDAGAAPLRSNFVFATGAALLVEPASVRRGDATTIAYDGFSAYEAVSLWSTSVAGIAVELGSASADGAGRLVEVVDTGALVPGAYTLTAKGMCSGALVTGSLSVMP